eukprot:jgi/Ulvmu1/2814/UM142_0012.1
MPSMRLNTQAAGAPTSGAEWQTVGTKVKAKKPKQDEPASELPAARPEAPKTASVAPRAPIVAPVSSNGTYNPYEPEELGSQVLAAYDSSWNVGVNGNAQKNGKTSKVAEAPALPAPAAPTPAAQAPAPVTNGNAASEAKAAKKKKKKNKAAAAAQPADVTLQANGTKAAAEDSGSKGKSAQQSKSRALPATANGTQSRSLPKAASTVESVSLQAGLIVELDEYLEALESKHPGEGLLQLQLLSSWLSRAFAGVSYHQSVVLDKAGIAGALDDPWGDLATPVRDSLLAFASGCGTQHAGHFLTQAAEQTLAALPEKGGAATDVGQLLLLAAVCRGAPLALPAACAPLSHLRSKLLSPGRLPVLLWLIGQAAKAGSEGSACAVNCWARVVLPSILHQEVLPAAAKPAKKGKGGGKAAKPASVYHIEPAARDIAVAFFHDVLLDTEGSHHRKALMFAARDGLPYGSGGTYEPVVPLAAVSAADAAASGAVATTRGTPEAVEGMREQLEELCACCGATTAISAAITRALGAADSAGGYAERSAAASAVADQLARHEFDAADAWARLHRANLGGSSAVLETLADNDRLLAPLLATPKGSDVLLRAMDGIAKTQASILATGKQTPARDLAQRSQEAMDSLGSSSVKVIPASAKWSLVSLVALTAGAIIVATNSPQTLQGLLEPVVGNSSASGVTGSLSNLGEGVAELVGAMWDSFIGDK